MFAVQPGLGYIPADTVGPPAILNVSAVVKNKPFLIKTNAQAQTFNLY
jgi:hypothetical protein